MSGSPRVDELEKRVATLESRLRLLTTVLVLVAIGFVVLLVAPGMVRTWFPTLVALVIGALAFGFLQSSFRE